MYIGRHGQGEADNSGPKGGRLQGTGDYKGRVALSLFWAALSLPYGWPCCTHETNERMENFSGRNAAFS